MVKELCLLAHLNLTIAHTLLPKALNHSGSPPAQPAWITVLPQHRVSNWSIVMIYSGLIPAAIKGVSHTIDLCT